MESLKEIFTQLTEFGISFVGSSPDEILLTADGHFLIRYYYGKEQTDYHVVLTDEGLSIVFK